MTGSTHIPAGIATSLVIIRPTTLTGTLCAVAGDAVGGWICDIDIRNNELNKNKVKDFILMAVIVGLTLVADYFYGDGICDYVLSHVGIPAAIEAALFIVWFIAGMASDHRTLTHSVFSLMITSVLLYILCRPIALAYFIGFSSHLLLDLTNKRKMQLFYPFKPKMVFGWCSSDGTANKIIGAVSTVASLILFPIFLFGSTDSKNMVRLFNIGNRSSQILGLSYFVLYLIVINIVTFIVYLIDFHLCMKGIINDDDESEGYFHEYLNILALLGGVLGALLSFVVLGNSLNKDSATWWARIISILIAWIVLVLIVINPSEFGHLDKEMLMHHWPLFAYYAALNIVTAIAFIKDSRSRYREWNARAFLLYFLSLLGGALGGYIVISITGKKKNTAYYYSLPAFIMAHTIVIAYLLYAGIV